MKSQPKADIHPGLSSGVILYTCKRYAHSFQRVSRTPHLACAGCLPEAHTALAAVHQYITLDWDAADQAYEDVLDSRGGEISFWIQAELYKELGTMYLSSEMTNERKDRINTAYNMLSGVRREDNGVERRFKPFEKTYEEVMAR